MLDEANIVAEARLFDTANMTETTANPPIYDRLMALKPEGWSNNKWAVEAKLSRNVFNDIRRHGNPTSDTLQKLLDAIDVSWAQFDAGTAPRPRPSETGGLREAAVPFTAEQAFARSMPRDVPILGTPSCGHIDLDVDGTVLEIETIDLDVQDTHDFARRPIGLMGRKDAYAIYYTGFSMVPKFEPNELGFVDPKTPPSIGDYVVVQLRAPDEEEGERIVHALVKRLARRTATYVELEQFNPAMTFRLPMARVARMHRIMTLNELAGV